MGGGPQTPPGAWNPPARQPRWRAQGRTKIIAGVAALAIGLLTLLLALPIFWGSLLFGGYLIYSGLRDLRRAGPMAGPAPGGMAPAPPPLAGTSYGVRAVRCPRCGTENVQGSRFCGRCGQTLVP